VYSAVEDRRAALSIADRRLRIADCPSRRRFAEAGWDCRLPMVDRQIVDCRFD
jgi:hypothetical protein